MKKNLDSEWKVLTEIAGQDMAAFQALLENTEISLAIACFHGQQAVEKYIKAVLGKKKIPFPFTHDLLQLYHVATKNGLEIPVSIESLAKLNPFAVKQRYDRPPEIHVTRQEAKDIVDTIAKWCKKQIHD